MKQVQTILLSLLILGCAGCTRSTDDVWNDTKTASRHMGRGVTSLGGKRGTSRQIAQQGEFDERQRLSRRPKDFIPLDDEEDLLVGDAEAIPAPLESPGDEGSSVPGVDAFKDPALDPNIAGIFEHIHFPYNSSLIKGEDNLHTLQQIVSYLAKHPRMSVFIEGHCDKRGSAAYNFALGANRANTVRTALVREGASPDRLFTISYGKEHLLFDEDGEEFHLLNHRGQFKIYEK